MLNRKYFPKGTGFKRFYMLFDRTKLRRADKDGIVGYMPVYKDKEAAQKGAVHKELNYVGNIIEVDVKNTRTLQKAPSYGI